ncbi:hypothetical protein D9M68_431240 [compost metagenome]
MLSRLPHLVLLCGSLTLAGGVAAHGSNSDAVLIGAVVGAVIGGAVVASSPPPVYVQPAPVGYYPPPPAYYYPPPAAYYPPPVYYQPYPVYRQVIVVPGPRYYRPVHYGGGPRYKGYKRGHRW